VGDPELSVVIPVYNERSILRTSVDELCGELDARGLVAEIVLAENGSKDDTVAIARAIAAERPQVSTFSYPQPNYGGALREGIRRARGTFVVCEEIDLCDVDFHARALALLRAREADMVVGSKAMRGAHDTRPWVRRLATRVYNFVLRMLVGFRGTDTHGLKAFRRELVAPIAERCVVEHDVFASELVVRAQREGLRVVEIPVEVHEKRAPSIHLFSRVPRVLKNLVKLTRAIHGAPRIAAEPRADAREAGDG
jgi:glycosyltransferase involved in cell wall biosynthesis